MSDECTCVVCQWTAMVNPVAIVQPKTAASFEDRVVALAKVLLENAPMAERIASECQFRFKWADALISATDIILAADGYNIDGACTCD